MNQLKTMNDFVYNSSTTEYYIRLAIDNDLDSVLEFVRKYFLPEETMFKSLCSNGGITEEELVQINKDHDELVEKGFKTAPCLLAIHRSTNKIVGVNHMILSENPKLVENASDLLETCDPQTDLMKKYYHYLMDIGNAIDLFNKFPNVEEVLEFYAVAVDKDHRRKGISKDLILAGISLGQRIPKVSLVFGIFTSIFSTKSAYNCNMDHLMDFDLLTFKSDSGTPIFSNTQPHNNAYVMYKST